MKRVLLVLFALLLCSLFFCRPTPAVTAKALSEGKIKAIEQSYKNRGYETRRIAFSTKSIHSDDPCRDKLGDGWRTVVCWFTGCLCYRNPFSTIH